MVAAGISDKEIGSALGEHANTVTHRIERLGRRHGFDSRMEFVVWATQVGLVR